MTEEEADRRKKVAEAETLSANAKLAEIEARRKRSWYERLNWTVVASIIIAVIGFLGGAWIESLKAENQIKAEGVKSKKQLESSLILEAMKTPSHDDALSALTFFIEIGFIDDPDGRIRSLANKEGVPNLPPSFNLPAFSWMAPGAQLKFEDCIASSDLVTEQEFSVSIGSLVVQSCATTNIPPGVVYRLSNPGDRPILWSIEGVGAGWLLPRGETVTNTISFRTPTLETRSLQVAGRAFQVELFVAEKSSVGGGG